MNTARKAHGLPIRVLVLDPPNFGTEAIAKSIERFPDITVIQSNCTAAEAAAKARSKQIDVIVVPHTLGAAIRKCRRLLAENSIQGLVTISAGDEIRFWHEGRFHESSLDNLCDAIRASCGRRANRSSQSTTAQPTND